MDTGTLQEETTSRAAIEAQLTRILECNHFRNSEQCRKFLQTVVTAALTGQQDLLKERTLAVTVFGRPATYDPAVDSVVRVKASEVRKRLAQYYAVPGHQSEVRIDLPPGSYVPEFSNLEHGSAEAAAKLTPLLHPPRRRYGVRFAIALAAILGFVAIVLLLRVFARSPLEEFWRPVQAQASPVLVTIGNSAVYSLSRAPLDRYHIDAARMGEGPVALPPDPNFKLSANELISEQGQYVGVGGAYAAMRFSSQLTKMGNSCLLRTGSQFNFSDLRDHPSILVGAFSNRWTLMTTNNLRFRFARGERMMIQDVQHPQAEWSVPADYDRRNLTDYAIVARLLRSDTGGLLIVAAGLTQYGCAAAADFLTDAKEFERGMRNAPPDWSSKNIELVIRCKVVSGTPGPPEVVATHFW